uniref:Uncharacterized protein n=1 Tax=Timema cristinae TaxID=61476 RepID=A0A7R9GQC4_TIMCR|nr:unnamed protein product [Timema cristinae]
MGGTARQDGTDLRGSRGIPKPWKVGGLDPPLVYAIECYNMGEMCLMGYRFIILDGAFLVHTPSIKRRSDITIERTAWRRPHERRNIKMYEIWTEARSHDEGEENYEFYETVGRIKVEDFDTVWTEVGSIDEAEVAEPRPKHADRGLPFGDHWTRLLETERSEFNSGQVDLGRHSAREDNCASKVNCYRSLLVRGNDGGGRNILGNSPLPIPLDHNKYFSSHPRVYEKDTKSLYGTVHFTVPATWCLTVVRMRTKEGVGKEVGTASYTNIYAGFTHEAMLVALGPVKKRENVQNPTQHHRRTVKRARLLPLAGAEKSRRTQASRWTCVGSPPATIRSPQGGRRQYKTKSGSCVPLTGTYDKRAGSS